MERINFPFRGAGVRNMRARKNEVKAGEKWGKRTARLRRIYNFINYAPVQTDPK